MVYSLLHYEGIFVGASSALNMVGAVKVAEALGKGNTVGKKRPTEYRSSLVTLDARQDRCSTFLPCKAIIYD